MLGFVILYQAQVFLPPQPLKCYVKKKPHMPVAETLVILCAMDQVLLQVRCQVRFHPLIHLLCHQHLHQVCLLMLQASLRAISQAQSPLQFLLLVLQVPHLIIPPQGHQTLPAPSLVLCLVASHPWHHPMSHQHYLQFHHQHSQVHLQAHCLVQSLH